MRSSWSSITGLSIHATNAALLLVHGTNDEILPPETSAVVQMLAGHGEVVLLPGAGHLLSEAAGELRERLGAWIGERFADG